MRERFTELQAAVKSQDADKVWALLDARSRGEADRIAREIQAGYAKADPKGKAELENTLGLSDGEIGTLQGIGFLKTKRFRRKYDDLPDSKFEKVLVQGDSATAHYLETDGDHEKMIFVRQDGQWKVWLSMPKVSLAAQSTGTPASEEKAVREKFVELQAAVKSQDADAIWALMDAGSQAEARQQANDLRAAYAGAGAEEKAKQEEALGLSGKEIADLTGPGVLRSKRFRRKYHEFPESTVQKAVVQGENATVHFLEPDDDRETLTFVRQDGQWKAKLALPKLSQR